MKNKIFNRPYIILLFLVLTGVSVGFYMNFRYSSIDSLGFSSTPISSENQLMMTMAFLKKNIREQKVDDIMAIFDDNFEEEHHGRKIKKQEFKHNLINFFNKRKKVSPNKTFQRLSSSTATTDLDLDTKTSTFDLEIVLDSIQHGDQESTIKCKIQLVGELKNDRFEKEGNVKLTFVKEGNEWKLAKSEKFIEFLNN